jgi:hypothetical protein
MLGRTSPNSLSLGEFLYALDETLHLIWSLNIENILWILSLIGKSLPFIIS